MSVRPDKDALYRTRVEQGKCGICGHERDAETVYCSTCREKQAKRQQSVYARRLANACCHRCGQSLGEARGKTCIPCSLKSIARKRLGNEARWEELLTLFEKQEKRCAISGQQLMFGLNASLDHKLATSRGGTHDLQNLQWVTKQVNEAKNSHSETELIEMCYAIIAHQNRKKTQNGY